MSNCNCKWGGCVWSKSMRVLLVVGGLNWGLVGLGMLLGKGAEWNVINMLLGSWPVVEAIIYSLVGIAAVIKLIGCKCKKCVATCASCSSCQTSNLDQKM